MCIRVCVIYTRGSVCVDGCVYRGGARGLLHILGVFDVSTDNNVCVEKVFYTYYSALHLYIHIIAPCVYTYYSAQRMQKRPRFVGLLLMHTYIYMYIYIYIYVYICVYLYLYKYK